MINYQMEIHASEDRNTKLKDALRDILSYRGKTLLADCCVENNCNPHYDNSEKVAHCSFQYGVFSGYSTTADIAREALADCEGKK